jgi:hypothetical protein
MNFTEYAATISDPTRKHRDPTGTLNDFARIKFEELPRSPLYDDTGIDPMGMFIDENGQPIAIIVDQADLSESTCYQFIGQHSQISAKYAVEKLESVDPCNAIHMTNCAELIYELIGQGYKPAIYRTAKFRGSLNEWDQFIATGIDMIE